MEVLQYSNGVNNGYHETRARPSHCRESLTLCYGRGQGYRLLNYTIQYNTYLYNDLVYIPACYRGAN